MASKYSFDDRIEQLVQFQQEHGHLFVAYGYKPYGLGNWVNNTRAARRQRKLKADSIARLDEIDFVWDVPKGPEKDKIVAWGKQYRLLVTYYNTRGNCDVPAIVAGQKNPIYTWCEEQRLLYINGKLEQAKVDKLTKIGFDYYGQNNEQPVSRDSCRVCLPMGMDMH